MVRFQIEIEADAGDPKEVNIVLTTESSQAAEAEQESARRLLPSLRKLLKSRFPESDESLHPEEIPAHH